MRGRPSSVFSEAIVCRRVASQAMVEKAGEEDRGDLGPFRTTPRRKHQVPDWGCLGSRLGF